MNERKNAERNDNVDPLTLTLFVLQNNRYSAIDKLVYVGYNLLLLSVALSIIGVILLLPGGASSNNETNGEEISQAYGMYYGILLIGLPVVIIFRKIAEPRYKGVYISLKNKEKKK
ncbi:MAG: hypothetical protein WAX07_05545 [Candidatus Altiarchaeia archaeon]